MSHIKDHDNKCSSKMYNYKKKKNKNKEIPGGGAL